MINDRIIKFSSGESTNEVFRIGNIVYRTRGKNSKLTHQIYKELENAGFAYSPKLLGIDDYNREMISFIDGDNISDENLSFDIAIDAIRILRQFHDIFSNSEINEGEETICHMDYAPWNVLIKDGKIVGIIDFDDARPGNRLTDLVYASWTFLKLGHSNLNKSVETQIDEISGLIEAYGDIDVTNFVDELLKEQKRVLTYRKKRTLNAVNERDKNQRVSVYNEIKKQIEWTENNKIQISSKLANN